VERTGGVQTKEDRIGTIVKTHERGNRCGIFDSDWDLQTVVGEGGGWKHNTTASSHQGKSFSVGGQSSDSIQGGDSRNLAINTCLDD